MKPITLTISAMEEITALCFAIKILNILEKLQDRKIRIAVIGTSSVLNEEKKIKEISSYYLIQDPLWICDLSWFKVYKQFKKLVNSSVNSIILSNRLNDWEPKNFTTDSFDDFKLTGTQFNSDPDGIIYVQKKVEEYLYSQDINMLYIDSITKSAEWFIKEYESQPEISMTLTKIIDRLILKCNDSLLDDMTCCEDIIIPFNTDRHLVNVEGLKLLVNFSFETKYDILKGYLGFNPDWSAIGEFLSVKIT